MIQNKIKITNVLKCLNVYSNFNQFKLNKSTKDLLPAVPLHCIIVYYDDT